MKMYYAFYFTLLHNFEKLCKKFIFTIIRITDTYTYDMIFDFYFASI